MQSQKLTGVGKLGQIQNMNSIVDSIWPVRPDNAKELINNVPFLLYKVFFTRMRSELCVDMNFESLA